jgi:hypothetical protein
MRAKLPRGTLARLWSDPANWRATSYACEEDPRIIVPKRNPIWGWTINWAHGGAAMRCFIGIVIVIGVMGLAATTHDQMTELAATVLVIIAVVGGCWWLADSRRYEEPG